MTLEYNTGEALSAIITGTLAGSVALVGFGIDSVIEVVSSAAALCRLRADVDTNRRERAERLSLRIIGACFVGLAVYIAIDTGHALWAHEAPARTIPGIVVASLSVVIMPLLARGKRRVAAGLQSRALHADATQTDLCMYLSAIVLAGLALNALFRWWWADPVAALTMTPIIAREGVKGLQGEQACDDCTPT